jgi:ribonucleoside-diphosphate reductase alpha chain
MSEDEKTIYSREEVLKNTLDYFSGDTLAADVCINKYLLKDKNGNLLEKSPDDMHRRLAKEFARIEAKYPNPLSVDEIYNLLKNFKYIIPQGSPMAGIGNDEQTVSLANCFVIGNKSDSYGGILQIDQELVQLAKRRGGVGTDLSHIRPENSPVNNAAITSTGVVPFMERFSNTTREVAQCLHEDTLVLTECGLLKIKDIQSGTKVWTKNGFVRVLDNIKNSKVVSKLTTKFGNEVICSSDHVIHTIIGEKKLIDFVEGDDVTAIVGEGWDGKNVFFTVEEYVSPKNSLNQLNEDVTLPTKLTDDLAYFLGYCYGNGYTDNKGVIETASSWDEITEKNKRIVNELFNYEAKIQEFENYKKIRIHSTLIVNHLRVNHCLKEKADSINFPEFLLTAKKEIIFAFISGYFDADGCFKKGKKSFSISSICKDFLLSIQQIFYSWGIRSKIHTQVRKNENWKTLYLLSIDGSQNQKLFYDLMKESIKVNSQDLQEKKRDWTSTIYTTKDFNTKASKHKFIISDAQHLSYSTCVKLKEELGLDNKITLFKDFVETIEEMFDGEVCSVHDLILEEEHLFFGNGLYVHNSGRRGALMETIDIRHPDAENFIDAKLELKKVTGANISVKLSNSFMKSIETKEKFIQQFPVDSKTPTQSKEIDASSLWKKLVHNSWKTGEPGILFWDQILSESPADCYADEGFKTESVNPCSELSLAFNDSCRLLLLNLYSYVVNPFTKDAYFDFPLFEEHVKIAQRLMDDIVDLEEEKINKILSKIESDPESDDIKRIEKNLWEKILYTLLNGRRTGLGITAEGDMLAAMGLIYGNSDASSFAIRVHQSLASSALISSIEMTKDRGSFPFWNLKKEENNPFLKRVLNYIESYDIEWNSIKNVYESFGRRNIAMLTIAPAGSLSILTQTSSGIEPVFSLSYIRRRKINPNDKSATTHFIDETGDHWEEYNVTHPKFQTWATINGHGDLTHLPKEKIEELIKISPYFLSTANEINALEKARMIGKIQQYIDHSISVTYNLPESATEGDVEDIFLEAWKSGCKGLTVYRDKCRSGVLVNHTAEEENKINIFKENHAPKRGKVLPCDIIRFSNKGEKWIGFLGLLDNKPYEVFTGPQDMVPIPSSITSGEIVKDKAPDGSKNIYNLRWVDKDGFTQEFKGLSRAFNREYWNIGRLVSGILRHGMPLRNLLDLIDSLEIDGSESITNWKNGVKRMLKKYIADGTKIKGEVCPECGSSNIIFKEGCLGCSDCGWSKCG